VRGAALPAAVVLLTSCGALSPNEELPAGAEPMAAAEAYQDWWSATEACADLTGDYDRVEWFVVPGVRSFQTDVGEKVGLWIKEGGRRQIVIAARISSSGASKSLSAIRCPVNDGLLQLQNRSGNHQHR